MSLRFNIKVEAAGLIKRAQELSASMKNVQRPTREIALRLIDRGRERLQARPPGKYPPVRTGLLARSLYARPETATGVVVASQFPYARIQQQGGIVLPTHGKCLAIPMTTALKRAGTWPRDWPRGALTFIYIGTGNVVGKLVKTKAEKISEYAMAPEESRKVIKIKEKISEARAVKVWKRKGGKLRKLGKQLQEAKAVAHQERLAAKQKHAATVRGKHTKHVESMETQYLLVRSSVIFGQPYIVWDSEMKQTTRDAWSRHLKGTAIG
jgi:hypothetical protein